ncbi:MAG: histidine kinase, partial [Nocardioides sp.]
AEPLAQAIWPWQLVGFVLVLLAFPAESLRRPVAVRALLAGGSALLLILVGNWGTEPDGDFAGWRVPVVVVGLVALVASVLLATVDLVRRSRGAGTTGRQQARWLLLATGAVVMLMTASWLAVPQLVPADVGYTAFLVAIYVLVPGAVAIAVIRHDLLDIDRLLGDTAAVVATSVVAALAWAGTVVVAQGVVRDAAAWETGAAAFVTALVLVPAHRWAHSWSASVFDRERTVLLAGAREFAAEVHQGGREPEEVEEVLRGLLRDPGLRVGLAVPGRPGSVDPSGEATDVRPDAVLRAGDAVIGTVELTRPSTRQRRLAQEAARVCWSAFESARLRAGLRAALVEVAQSRTRLEVAASDERRKLERDLHDGAQQALIAIGMRLRSAQGRLSTGSTEHADVEAAIGQLGETVAELRRISQGIRPARLDDGLGPALEALRVSTPLPLALRVDPAIDHATLPEPLAQAAYFVIAEAVANALKHAHASAISVEVDLDDGVRVSIADDGVGGVDPRSGLVALRDRVASVGGTLEVESPPGAGTRLKAVL